MGKRRGARMLSQNVPLSSNLPVFTSPEALQTQSFWVFMAASLHRHDWLSHLPLVSHSTSSPCPLPRGQGMGWKLQVSNHRVGSSGDQPTSLGYLGAFQKSFINIKTDTFITLIIEEIPGVLGALCQNGTDTKHTFLIISHSNPEQLSRWLVVLLCGMISLSKTKIHCVMCPSVLNCFPACGVCLTGRRASLTVISW